MLLFGSVRGNSNVCVVVFSPLATGATFGWWNTLKDVDASLLFVKDTKNNWYLDISPDGKVKDFSNQIIEQLEKLNLSSDAKIYCVGPSMGGFAAFYYARALNATACFATSLEETLNKFGSISKRHIKNNNFSFSLNEFLDEKIDYHLFVGELDFFDLYSACLLPKCVRISVIPDSGHLVPEFLEKNPIGISGVVKSLIGGWDIIYKNSPFSIDSYRRIILSLYDSWCMNLNRKPSSFQWDELDFKRLPKVLKILMAKDYYFLGRKSASLKIMQSLLAEYKNFSWDVYHFNGLILRDLGFFKEAISSFREAERLNPKAIANAEQIKLLQNFSK